MAKSYTLLSAELSFGTKTSCPTLTRLLSKLL
jgi:hypothetical protein